MVSKLYHVNRKLKSTSTYIYGTGAHAKSTYLELFNQGVEVVGFLDQSVEGEKSLLGKIVISEKNISRKSVIIIASTAWKDIYDRLKILGFCNLFVDIDRYGEVEVKDEFLRSVGKYTLSTDVMYICCPAGIGDTLMVAAMAGNLKTQRENVTRICLITKNVHKDIAKLFPLIDDVIADDNLVDYLENYSVATKTWYLRNYIYGHIKKNKCQTFEVEYYDLEERNMVSIYRDLIFKLEKNSMIESMKIPDMTNCKERMDAEKKILLIPYARTAKMISEVFWKNLVKFLAENGYILYTNVKDSSEREILGTVRFEESIIETVRVAEQFDCVIGIRSGICDVLAFTKVPLVVINTDKALSNEWNLELIRGANEIYNISCFSDQDELSTLIQIKKTIKKLANRQ